MNIEALGLEAGNAVGNGLEQGAHGVQMIEPFLQAKVTPIVGTMLIQQEAGEFFVLFEKSVLLEGAKDVMAMLELIEDRGQLSA
jgi:hypothetical protein